MTTPVNNNPIASNRNQPWALITGASAGLGSEFARQLAVQNYNLVLTARRADRLEALARELSERHRIEIRILPADLSNPLSPQRIFDVLERDGIAIEMLINNAGLGMPGEFHQHPWTAHQGFMQLMVDAPMELAHLALKSMQSKKRGFIVNVASLAGFMPGTQAHTLYAASKSFLIKFSESLSQENARFGIHVLALCPGFTYTEFHDANGTRERMNHLPKFVWMTAETVVRQGILAVQRGDPVYINGWWNRFLVMATRVLPRFVVYWLLKKQQRKFRAVEP